MCFLSQDDKARVVIGLAAANKQAPILMHVEYKVSLPDHDWVVAQRHKLIPFMQESSFKVECWVKKKLWVILDRHI